MSKDLAFNCPFCVARGKSPDTSENLNIVAATGIYHCFRCGASPKKTGSLPQDILSKVVAVVGQWGAGAYDVLARNEEQGAVDLPHEVVSCQECRDYLISRGYLPAHVNPYVFGGAYAGHRIFWTDDRPKNLNASRGSTTQWLQGRAISPRNPVRYISKPGYGRPMVLSLRPDATGETRPVLVEGPFDALRLVTHGIAAICLFGVSFGKEKAAEVQRILWKSDGAMLCLDRDGTDNEARLWAWELAKFLDVRVWPIRAADPDTMDLAEIKQLLKEVRK